MNIELPGERKTLKSGLENYIKFVFALVTITFILFLVGGGWVIYQVFTNLL